MYQAVRQLKNNKGETPLLIHTAEGLTTEPSEQVKAIKQYFKEMFSKEDQQAISRIPPKQMTSPFTGMEVQAAVNSLKNNKRAGIDNIKSEQLKYGPDLVYNSIADILNITASTGHYPEEIKQSILVPLHKPKKKKGPQETSDQ